MCGRFALSAKTEDIEKLVQGMTVNQNLPPRTNIAPTQKIAALANDGNFELKYYKWGLIPRWAKDESIGNKLFNARSETLSEKPSFRDAFKYRRCLIFTDWFYEWQKLQDAKTKQIYKIGMADGKTFTFGGLWEQWRNPNGETILSATIITTSPNKVMEPIHERMPVIIPYEIRLDWLEGKSSIESLKDMMAPFPEDNMIAIPIDKIL
ncbi:MAG: hypothetical protein HW421_623 [Ignavibacteria bacterium]|nr:hypothetical protein [Ignavibacteria bacterium]